MYKHTPGPWALKKNNLVEGKFEIRPANISTATRTSTLGSTDGYAPLAYVQGDKRVTGGDGEANAKLMTAAPGLLLALHAIAKGGDNPQHIAQQAIKEAESIQLRQWPKSDIEAV